MSETPGGKTTVDPTSPNNKDSVKKPVLIGLAVAMVASAAFNAGIWYGMGLEPKQKVATPESTGTMQAVPAVATIASTADPFVVTIHLTPIDPTKKKGPDLNLPMLQMQEPQPRSAQDRRPIGSGVIIGSDGYILTSSHVLHANYDVRVTLNDKRTFDAKIIGKDPFMDIAVIKIEATGLPVAKFGDSTKLRVGEWAIAVGSPYGFEHSVTLGIISGIGRSLEQMNNNTEMIQTDAALNHGNSGGPLLNAQGEVIGINTAIRNQAQNISFAIPSDRAQSIAKEIEAHGSIARPYLGIHMMDIDAQTAKAMGYPEEASVIVAYVMPDSPCQKAGLDQHDLIEKVDQTAVKSALDVRKIIQQHKPNDVLAFSLARKDGHEVRKVKLGTYPESLNY
ncbi:MAG TPA: trypsin-like peptidase domain-containing protein [Drouetiella sp.]|jgi:serine protease Do